MIYEDNRVIEVLFSPYVGKESEAKFLGQGTQRFKAKSDPLTYFIYRPWFEDIEFFNHTLISTRNGIIIKNGPYWFGNNSTRGILSKTLADMIEEASHPSTQTTDIPWIVTPDQEVLRRLNDGIGWVDYNWKLDEYLRTAVSRYSGEEGSTSRDDQAPTPFVADFMIDHYSAPKIKWEFLHDKLPIVKVTAENAKVLPLTRPTLEEPTKNRVLGLLRHILPEPVGVPGGPQPVGQPIRRTG